MQKVNNCTYVLLYTNYTLMLCDLQFFINIIRFNYLFKILLYQEKLYNEQIELNTDFDYDFVDRKDKKSEFNSSVLIAC